MPAGLYLQTVVLCQIPVTLVAGLIYLAAWVVRGGRRGSAGPFDGAE